jgi:hypothetical protein
MLVIERKTVMYCMKQVDDLAIVLLEKKNPQVLLDIPASLRDCSHELTFTDTAASLSLANKSPYSTEADGTTSRQGLQALLSSCLRRASSSPTSSNILWARLTTDKHSARQ